MRKGIYSIGAEQIMFFDGKNWGFPIWMKSNEIPENPLNVNVFTFERELKIVFKNPEGLKKEITVTVKQLLENTTDDFYEWLDDTVPCTSASCNNESQNFCDCGSVFEDYEISEIIF